MDQMEMAPLALAAGAGHTKVVKVLLQSGANSVCRDKVRRHSSLTVAPLRM